MKQEETSQPQYIIEILALLLAVMFLIAVAVKESDCPQDKIEIPQIIKEAE